MLLGGEATTASRTGRIYNPKANGAMLLRCDQRPRAYATNEVPVAGKAYGKDMNKCGRRRGGWTVSPIISLVRVSP